MRTVLINPPIFAIHGDLRLKVYGDVDLERVERRVSRTATLDGGAVLADTGYSSGDRIFELRLIGISQADSETIQTWTKNYATLHVATHQSVYEAAPERYSYASGVGQLRLLVISDLVND